MRVLRRFTARQSLAEPIFRPPASLGRYFKSGFEEIISEFDSKRFGREMRLRTLPRRNAGALGPLGAGSGKGN